MSLGATHFLPEKNRVSYWRKDVLDQLVVLMGGRVAEEIFIGDVSSGAQQDIAQATKLARSMICQWGMSEGLGLVAYDERDFSDYVLPQHDKSYSEETARLIDKEVRQLLDEAHARATSIIQERRQQVELMAQLLMEFETLDAEDVKDIVADKWDSEKKRTKMVQERDHFKRQPELPPPPPPKEDFKKTDHLGLDPV